jgi:hypothetical protein
LDKLIKRNINGSLITHQSIEWKPFLKIIALLDAAKRDSVPEETARAWYSIFHEMGWTEQQVKDKVWAILKRKSYGNATVRIDDFFEDEKTFTESEINLLVNKRIASIIQRAIEILNWQGKPTDLRAYFCDFFKIDNEEIRLAIADQVIKTYEVERMREIDFILQEEYERQIELVRARRVTITVFDKKKRKKLLELLNKKGVITLEKKGWEYETFLKNIGIFAGDLTDEEIKQIAT